MKNMRTKTLKLFKDNVWLTVAVVVLLFGLGLAGWKFSLHIARISQENNSINVLMEVDSALLDDPGVAEYYL